MVGTSDLLSQIADREYLEKISLLWDEFIEGNVTLFTSKFDLYSKTVGFFEVVNQRFEDEFDNINRYMVAHFQSRFNINEDLYRKAVDKNARYLGHMISQGEDNLFHNLRRRTAFTQNKPTGM